MFDIGWTEMLVVAVIAIVFVGPKELPGMIRTFGRMIKKVKGLAGEFQGQFDEALKEAELDGIKDTINDVRSLDPTKAIKDKLNPLKDDLEKPVEKTPDKTPQEIEAEIASDFKKAQTELKSQEAAVKSKAKKPATVAKKASAAKKASTSSASAKKPAAKPRTAKSAPRAKSASKPKPKSRKPESAA